MVYDIEGGVVRIDLHQFLADPPVLLVDALSLLIGYHLVERVQVLSLGPQFVRGVVVSTDLLHLPQQDVVLVVDLQQPVCLAQRVPLRLISSLCLEYTKPGWEGATTFILGFIRPNFSWCSS